MSVIFIMRINSKNHIFINIKYLINSTMLVSKNKHNKSICVCNSRILYRHMSLYTETIWVYHIDNRRIVLFVLLVFFILYIFAKGNEQASMQNRNYQMHIYRVISPMTILATRKHHIRVWLLLQNCRMRCSDAFSHVSTRWQVNSPSSIV